MKTKKLASRLKNKRDMRISACITKTTGHDSGVLRNEYLNLIAEIEADLLARKRLANQFKDDSKISEACGLIVSEAVEDLKAAKRLLNRFDTSALKDTANTVAALPKTVGVLLREYLLKQVSPFSVEDATIAINQNPGVNVTTSAVSQALRRITDGSVKIAQEGKGPMPAYYQSTVAVESAAANLKK